MRAPDNLRFQAVAWDIDGTLVDSEPLHSAALAAVCADHVVDLDADAADAFMGVSIMGVWQAIGDRFGGSLGRGDAEREAGFYRAIHARYATLSSLLRPQPGAREAVAWLRAQSIAQCAVSNSHASIVATNLRVLDAGDAIRFSLALDDMREPKPSPAPYLQACERLGLAPAHVLAIEDSETGLRSAVAAGLATVLLTPLADSTTSAPAWHRLATHRLATLETLPAWLRGDASQPLSLAGANP